MASDAVVVLGIIVAIGVAGVATKPDVDGFAPEMSLTVAKTEGAENSAGFQTFLSNCRNDVSGCARVIRTGANSVNGTVLEETDYLVGRYTRLNSNEGASTCIGAFNNWWCWADMK